TTARQNAQKAYGAAYRLGAYGTLPNSIVLEFDTSTDNYYQPDAAGSGRNFGISDGDIRKTGDYNYATGAYVNAWPDLDGLDIAESAHDKSMTGKTGIQNATHIGISTTGADAYVS